MTDEKLREKIAKFEFQFVLTIAHAHEFTMTTYTWKKLEQRFKEYYYHRADQIINFAKKTGFVRLAKDQTLPDNPHSPMTDRKFGTFGEGQESLLKKNWRKVESK
jgi:hypothetical protein